METESFKVIDGPGVPLSGSMPRGLIIRRPDGLLILRCPMCSGIAWHAAKISGTDEEPTVDAELKCGCHMCRTAYKIEKGKARITGEVFYE
jgi:uncharacterized protein YbaR (Trm112 family)